MYLYKILLLLFSNLFIQISTFKKIHSIGLKTRKLNSDHSCVCFPGGQSLIPELLNPQDNGLERLVVYLYRDVNTNEIKLFIPSPEKQSIIPNIPFASDDVLKQVTTESVASLISPMVNNVLVNPVWPDHPLTETVPIGLNFGTIEKVNPQNSYIDIIQVTPQQSHLEQNQPQQGYQRQILYPQQDYQPYLHPHQSQPQKAYPQQIPQPQNILIPGQNLQNVLPTNDGITHSPKRNTWEFKNNVPVNPFQPIGPQNIFQGPSESVDPNQINISLNKQEVYSPGGDINKGYLTFDQWFNKQMDTFHDANSPQDIKAIDVDHLRSLVQETLFDNHMHIGSTGLITDANGALINLDNLQLRPVLIGNSVTYQQVLKGSQQLMLPKNLPYLEGLLITLIYPPKVLGVIPLGKTYVSQDELQSPLTTPSAGIHYPGPDFNLGPILSVTNSPYSTGERLPGPNIVTSSNISPLYPTGGGSSSISIVGTNPFNENFLWGTQLNPNLPHRSSDSTRTPKPPRNPKKTDSNTRKQLKHHKGSRKSPNGTKVPSGLKPSSLSINSQKPLISAPGWNSNNGINGISKAPWDIDWIYSIGLNYPPPNPNDISVNPQNGKLPLKESPSFNSYQNYYPNHNSLFPPKPDSKSPYLNQVSWNPLNFDQQYNPSHQSTPQYKIHDPQLTVTPTKSSSSDQHYYAGHNSIPQPIPPQLTVIPSKPSSSPHFQTNSEIPRLTVVPLSSSSSTQKYYESHNNPPHSVSNLNFDAHSNSNPNLIDSQHNQIANSGSSPGSNWKTHSVEPNHGLYPSIQGQPQQDVIVIPSSNTKWISQFNPEWKPHISSDIINVNPNPLPKNPNTLESGLLIAEPITAAYPYSTAGYKPVGGQHHQNIITAEDSILQKSKPLGQSRRFSMPSLQGVLKTLINMVLQNLSQSHGNGIRKQNAGNNATISNPIEKTGDVQDGDSPDFRIIGGSAATGSGSPLSNKGRSGIIK